MAKKKTVAPELMPKHDAGLETPAEKVDVKSLKICPKCGDSTDGPYQDKSGNWRCHCSHPKCGFWDSMVYYTAKEAAAGWNAAGGPERDY